ncbi:MAG: hypothetical protein J6D54_12235 [Olsenella sp.]|nr:hypothetical protein [Olsenella sp.]
MHSMYGKLPNLVLGFHGCDQSVRDEVVSNGTHLKPSTNDYDWLGSGAYFWEQNYERAMQWAQEQCDRGRIEKPAVIGAVIDLGNCLNLTDSYYIGLVEDEYKLLADDIELSDEELPRNTVGNDLLLRRLDCYVIEHLHERIEHSIKNDIPTVAPFDSVRGLFSEGAPLYENAGFKSKTHVQICVRNPNCIKGYFIPIEQDMAWNVP